MIISSVKSIVKSSTTNECTSNATRFNSHADALVRCRLHCSMEGVQGLNWCHWMPPSGKYLHLSPGEQGGHILRKTTKKHHTCRPFCRPWQSAGMILRAPPGGEGSGHYDGSHWPPPLGEYCGRYKKLVMHTAVLFRVFSLSTRFSAGRGDVKVPNNIGVWHINQMGRS
jgi:hypothetical protein